MSKRNVINGGNVYPKTQSLGRWFVLWLFRPKLIFKCRFNCNLLLIKFFKNWKHKLTNCYFVARRCLGHQITDLSWMLPSKFMVLIGGVNFLTIYFGGGKFLWLTRMRLEGIFANIFNNWFILIRFSLKCIYWYRLDSPKRNNVYGMTNYSEQTYLSSWIT